MANHLAKCITRAFAPRIRAAFFGQRFALFWLTALRANAMIAGELNQGASHA
jgi:hypothetical protein